MPQEKRNDRADIFSAAKQGSTRRRGGLETEDGVVYQSGREVFRVYPDGSLLLYPQPHVHGALINLVNSAIVYYGLLSGLMRREYASATVTRSTPVRYFVGDTEWYPRHSRVIK